MKHKRCSRVLAILLTALLMLGMLPTTASAEGAEEAPAHVQAFLDAVEAINLPDEINEETGPALNDQLKAVSEAYDALSEEDLWREDVKEAVLKYQAACDTLTGGAETLSVQRRYVTLRPTTASGGTFGSVKVKEGDTVKSYNGRNSYEVRRVSGSEITVWVYLDNNGSFYFPKAADLWNDVSPVDYVYWSGNSSGKKTENGSGLTSNGAADSSCGLATYYLKAGSIGGGTTPTNQAYIKVIHQYYTNNSLDGTFEETKAVTPPSYNVPKTELASSYKKTTYNSVTYNYTSGSPNSISVSKDATGLQGTFELRYDRTVFVAPEKPTDEWVISNVKNAVKINCTNDAANHADKTYDLISGSFTVGAVTGSNGSYTCTVTVNNPQAYVTKYNTDVAAGHTLSPADQGAKTITLRYENGAWTVTTALPVVYTVKCEPATVAKKYTIVKTFTGIKGADEIPESYELSYSVDNGRGGSGKLGKTGATGIFDGDKVSLKWTVNVTVPAETSKNTDVTFTESNYEIDGYDWSSNTFDNNGSATRQIHGGTGDATEYLYNTYTPVAPPTDWTGLSITKTASLTTAKPGDSVTYTLLVTNNTGKTLTNVTVQDVLPEGIEIVEASCIAGQSYDCETGTWTIPSLAPGSTSMTIDAKIAANASGTITNTATITGATDPDGNNLPEDNKPSDSADVTIVTAKTVAVTKVFQGIQAAEIPADFSLDYKVYDSSSVNMVGDTFVVTGTAYLTGSTGGPASATVTTVNGHLALTWTIDIVETGDKSYFVFTENNDDVNGYTRYQDTELNWALESENVQITITNVYEKDDTPAAPAISRFTKELMTSAPDGMSVTGVTYPTGDKVTIPADGSVTLLYKLTVTGDPGAKYSISDEGATVVSGNLSGTIPESGEAVIYVTKTFAEPTNGKLTNTATIAPGENTTGPDDDDAAAEIDGEKEQPVQPETDWSKLTISKKADKTTAKPGEEITYTITVTNNTGKALTNVTVSDTLDSNLIFVSANNNGVNSNGTVMWTIASLANGGTKTLTLKAKVKDGVADQTVVPNTAVITDATADSEEDLPDGTKPSGRAEITVTKPQEKPDPENPSKPDNEKPGNDTGNPSKPDSTSPKTGDTSHIGLWISLLAVSLLGLGAVLLAWKKKTYRGRWEK